VYVCGGFSIFVVKQAVDHTELVVVYPSFSQFLERYWNLFCLISLAYNILKKGNCNPRVLQNALHGKKKRKEK
jgi:hypothetical protein